VSGVGIRGENMQETALSSHTGTLIQMKKKKKNKRKWQSMFLSLFFFFLEVLTE